MSFTKKELEELLEKARRLESHDSMINLVDFNESADTETVRKLVEAVMGLSNSLFKIADYDTLDGEKYVNHEQGWHGVAAYAKEALEKWGVK